METFKVIAPTRVQPIDAGPTYGEGETFEIDASLDYSKLWIATQSGLGIIAPVKEPPDSGADDSKAKAEAAAKKKAATAAKAKATREANAKAKAEAKAKADAAAKAEAEKPITEDVEEGE